MSTSSHALLRSGRACGRALAPSVVRLRGMAAALHPARGRAPLQPPSRVRMTHRATLLSLILAVGLLSGCSSPAPHHRTIPLDVPPARDLVLTLADLPPGYQQTTSE